MKLRCSLTPLAPSLFALAAAGGLLVGQTPVPVTGRPISTLRSTAPAATAARASSALERVVDMGGAVTAQDPAASAGVPVNDPVATERLARWKQLQFDRRRSTMLTAWAAPELKPYDPSEEQQPISAEVRDLLKEEFGIDPNEKLPAGAVPPAAANASAAAADAQRRQKELQREFEMVQRDVTLGRWDNVAKVFGTFAEASRKDAYEHFLRVLLQHPQTPQDQRVPANLQEKNFFSFDDVMALAGMAPGGFDKKQSALLAPLAQRAIESGNVLEELLRVLQAEIAQPTARIDRREAALVLSALGEEDEMGPFLPTIEEATAANDREAFNLMARHALAVYAKDKRAEHLERAWNVTHAALAAGEIEEADKAEALRRAIELAPQVRSELGPQWLEESFTKRPERGMEIIASIGGQVARGFRDQPQDTKFRAEGLKLQKTAVEALLDKSPELAEQWKPALALLAGGWVVEASYSYGNSKTDSVRPVMQRDAYGNIFWTDMRMGGGGPVQAVEPADVIAAQPGPRWSGLLDEAMRPHFLTVSAQLLLKVDEAEKAFPFIEQLAAINPRKARELADEFLRVWTRKANPNRGRTNSYMFMYGFEQRANGIPLTRSKQERNLAELARWVGELRKLPIGGVDQKLLSEAFATSHSMAEVPRLETMQKVFGDIGALDPVLLGELLQKMRSNLATVWRLPAVQDAQKTRRSQKQTNEQVLKGYETATTVAELGRKQHGDHWALLSVLAAVMHDQNNFSREQGRSSKFADQRLRAFEVFADAAADYARRAPSLRLDEESIGAFDTWFYAAVGACDLGAIDEETVVAQGQLPLIKKALASLPEACRDRHQTMFANALFTRMSAVKPQIKQRYLEAGFEVVGDHPQADEARQVYRYYQDLLGELKLEAVVDGPAEVGSEPFGVRIDIVHSPEIERESGGFTKYAQNQNNQPYAYNYGRPLENYRDRFQEALSSTVEEHFEVLSVTFNSDAMESRPTEDPAWKRTSYAYLLLKAKGPQVDRIPAIKVDFDFLDTSGYTVLAIGSSPVVVDASAKSKEARPHRDVTVTQVLDERRSEEGKITLEIKASAVGLVPDLDELVELDLPGFRIAKREDQGASVVKFAEDQETVASERVWLLSLEPADGESLPRTFRFGAAKSDDIKVVYQRYDDADLATVARDIQLGARGGMTPWWFWLVFTGALGAFFAWFFLSKPGGRGGAVAVATLQLPATINAFSVLRLLVEVRKSPRLDAAAKAALDADVARIERVHFGRDEDPGLDLAALAKDWLRRAL